MTGRPHVFLPGTGRPLLLLHGTGGTEHDLLPLRDHLAPGAPVLAPRGTVLENGMPRHFRRLREGVFDEDDLRERVAELAGFLDAAEADHGPSPTRRPSTSTTGRSPSSTDGATPWPSRS